jgi:hypothetical protein
MGTTKAAKVPALKLTLGGAPATWHSVDGLLGFYHPDIPTPLGGPGECPLDVAEAAAANDNAPVELVYISEAEAEKSRGVLGEQVTDAARALRDGYGATRQQVDATIEALAGPGAADINDDDEEA